ncbi:MAG: HAMP domain-containing sensor histidine kinase [Bdellovibrionota bacterium]
MYRNNPDFEVLILAPTGRDAEAAAEVLTGAGILARPYVSLSEVCERLGTYSGALLIAEEAMTVENADTLEKVLIKQQAWSSLPIILMTSHAERIFSAEKIIEMFSRTGSISILERPFRIVTLLATVRLAMKTRQRQYQVRDLMKQQELAVNQRDEFLSIASHELKTPMTSLKLQVQTRKKLLERGDKSVFDPDKVTSLIEITDRQVNRISRLVDDMLDISRIVNGKLSLNLEEVELRQLVMEVYKNLAHEFETADCDVTFRMEEEILVRCDRYRMEQVITNLFSNAIKYGACKPVTVSMVRENNHAVVSVTDSGMGIAEENYDRIFDRFERATGGSISGLGLGLYITKQILDMHKGTISVKSTLGKGSTFTFKIPLS